MRTVIEQDHLDLLLEEKARRLERERRFDIPRHLCPYDCDNGWHTILFRELAPEDLIPSDAAIVLPWGIIMFPCECNSRRLWSNSGYRTCTRQYPTWLPDLT